MNPLQALWLPTLYALIAAVSVGQLKTALEMMQKLAGYSSKHQAWLAVRPSVLTVSSYFHQTFGSDWQPTVSQILMVALMIAFIVHTERLRSAVLRS